MSSNVVPLRKPEPAPSAEEERRIYLRIFEHSKDSVFLIHPDSGAILFANPRAVEDTSYEAAELENLDFRALFLPEERGAITTLLESTCQWNTGVDPVRNLKRKTGRKILVEIATSIVEFGGDRTIFCSVRDITARVRAEEKIRKHNEELEDRVRERTRELAAVNDKLSETNHQITRQKKELDDVMSNIKQAIFTVGPDGRINPERSRFVAEVFGCKEPAGSDISRFLYDGEAVGTGGAETKDTLRLIFEDPERWSLLGSLLPRELKYSRPHADGTKDARDLVFEWVPVLEEAVLAKMMVVCLDVTEQKRLEAEIAQKETQHNEQLEMIARMIELPESIVAEFVNDTKRQLDRSRELLEKARTGPSPEVFNGLLHTLHTIKGASRQFKLNTIQNRAHDTESRVIALSQGKETLPEGVTLHAALTGQFAPLETALLEVHAFYAKIVEGKGGDASRNLSLHSIPLPKVESLIETETDERVRQALGHLLLVPVRTLFDRLEKIARSLSEELGTEIALRRTGDEIEIDFRLAASLYDALLHTIRNSIDHGAEPPADRVAAGKPAALSIILNASVFQDDLILEIGDDGRGVNIDAVKNRALALGLADTKRLTRLSEEQILQFAFTPGFSTRDSVSEISGRGIGLDVVKDVIERSFAGEVVLLSQPGRGTQIVARLPVMNPRKPAAPSHYCFPSGKLQTVALEKLLNLNLREVANTPDVAKKSGAVLSDLAGSARLRTRFEIPARRIICVDSLEPEPMIQTALDMHGLRHFVDAEHPASGHFLRACLRNVASRAPGGLASYFWPEAPVCAHPLREYEKKGAVLDELSAYFTANGLSAGITEVMTSIGDEMIMNAMFDAPRDAQGAAKYNHLPRTHRLVLEARESITVKYGVNAVFAGISVEDPHGALSYSTLVDYLKKCYAKGADQVSRREGGAGLGLFMIFDSCHFLVVNSVPGKKTEIIALVSRARQPARTTVPGKSLSFFLTE